MQVFINKEKIGTLSKTGNTTVQLSNSVLTIGAKQYSTGSLVLDISVDVDTGSPQSIKGYYIYAVVDSGNVKLIASLSNTNPLGYNFYKLIGAFFTDISSQVDYIGKIENGSVKQTKTLIQEMILPSDASETTLFTFNNLTIGEWYEISLQMYVNNSNAETNQYTIENGAQLVGVLRLEPGAVGQTRENRHATKKFQATESVLTISITGTGNLARGGNNKGETFCQLSQLNDHKTTSNWV